ncbi:hypothetical protein C8R45DRAFT_941704 [Mycena sanguinolenta]|nr:hypothetical protein C8R45DRAFT_941704 [Mycena sanguinolenta]
MACARAKLLVLAWAWIYQASQAQAGNLACKPFCRLAQAILSPRLSNASVICSIILQNPSTLLMTSSSRVWHATQLACEFKGMYRGLVQLPRKNSASKTQSTTMNEDNKSARFFLVLFLILGSSRFIIPKALEQAENGDKSFHSVIDPLTIYNLVVQSCGVRNSCQGSERTTASRKRGCKFQDQKQAVASYVLVAAPSRRLEGYSAVELRRRLLHE